MNKTVSPEKTPSMKGKIRGSDHYEANYMTIEGESR